MLSLALCDREQTHFHECAPYRSSHQTIQTRWYWGSPPTLHRMALAESSLPQTPQQSLEPFSSFFHESKTKGGRVACGHVEKAADPLPFPSLCGIWASPGLGTTPGRAGDHAQVCGQQGQCPSAGLSLATVCLRMLCD